RTGIPKRFHAPSRDRPSRPFFINNDAKYFDTVHLSQMFKHRLTIGHLRHSFGRNKAHRVNMPETSIYQSTEIFSLPNRRNLAGQALPCVAWTFDELDGFHLNGCYCSIT